MKTEIFVCDNCGERKRLDSRKEHWCEHCAGRKETEMRPVRIKLAAIPASLPVRR